MSEKKLLTIATDLDGEVRLFDDGAEWNVTINEFLPVNECFLLPEFLNKIIPPGHKAQLTIGEAVDCRPKAAESETAAAMAVLTKAAEKLPQGYKIGIDFGDRPGISVFGNGEVLKGDCCSFDVAVEIANDKATEAARTPELWAIRKASGLYFMRSTYKYYTDFIVDKSDLPELQIGFKCRIAWDEQGIRLIGTPERI